VGFDRHVPLRIAISITTIMENCVARRDQVIENHARKAVYLKFSSVLPLP